MASCDYKGSPTTEWSPRLPGRGNLTPAKGAIAGLLLIVALTTRAGWADDHSPAAEEVLVTYFHGTYRCGPCLEIERMARKTVEERFAPELEEGRMRWRSVDYDLPGNTRFLAEYGLTCPSLVVTRIADGKESSRTLLERTWELVDSDPEALTDYVAAGVGRMLSETD